MSVHAASSIQTQSSETLATWLKAKEDQRLAADHDAAARFKRLGAHLEWKVGALRARARSGRVVGEVTGFVVGAAGGAVVGAWRAWSTRWP